MVMKNNSLQQKLEKVAKRQQHFGIRKLTIGAASVLLGTTLWMGINANVAHAETNGDESNDGQEKAVTESNIDTQQINANTHVQVNAGNVKTDAGSQVNNNLDSSTGDISESVINSAKGSSAAQLAKSGAITKAPEQGTKSGQGAKSNNNSTTPASRTQQNSSSQSRTNAEQSSEEKAAQTAQDSQKLENAGLAGSQKLSHQQQVNKINFQELGLKAGAAANSLSASEILANKAVQLREAKGNTADEQIGNPSDEESPETAEAKELARIYGYQLKEDNPNNQTLNVNSLSASHVPVGQLAQILVQLPGAKARTASAADTTNSGFMDAVNQLIDDGAKGNWPKFGTDLATYGIKYGVQALTDYLNNHNSSKDDQNIKTDYSTHQSYVEASDWDTVKKYANDTSIDDIRITKDISADSVLDLSRSDGSALTIESAPAQVDANTPATLSADSTTDITKHTITFTNSTAIKVDNVTKGLTLKNLVLKSTNSKGIVQSDNEATKVTFNNVDAQNAPLFDGKGDVHIQGNVTSNVNNIKHADNDDMYVNFGDISSWGGMSAHTSEWYNANITASNVYIEKNANLDLNRELNGDGIVVTGGANWSSKGPKSAATGKQGLVNVDDNATLNITLKDGHATGAETSGNVENANTAVRAAFNGNFTTGTGAEVNIYAGHGRGIVFDQPVGGAASTHTELMTDWARPRYDVGQQNEANANNTFKLGDYTKFTLQSRDGVLLGNRANMNTGEHSTVTFNNYGNGIGLEGDANSNLIVGPHTVFLMHSDGKNQSGHWNAGNYIGLGENGQFTVSHDATFKFDLKNAWKSGSLNYADNFNIVSVKKDSNPTVNIENNAIFDGQSDYRNIFGEILSFSYNGTPVRTTVNIDGARYVNFHRHGATTPGGFQNVVSYDKQGKHSGNLFYSWPANTWHVNGNTYNVYKWTDETESQDTFNADDYNALVKSINDLNNSSTEYWTHVRNLTMGVNMHRSDLTDSTPEAINGAKKGWALNDKNGLGFDTEFSQRLALVATHIPTEEDKVNDDKNAMNTIIKYDPSLKPGQVKLIQKGHAGRIITTDRTYYTVDLSDPTKPQKIVDTSKGNNGHETIVTRLGDEQDRIIAIAPETATINYVDDQGNAIKDSKGAIVGTVTAVPVKTDANGNVVFDKNGNVTAEDVNYNENNDLSKAEAVAPGYVKVPGQDTDSKVDKNGLNWEYAISNDGVKAGANKYNVEGLTKQAIIDAASKLQQADPKATYDEKNPDPSVGTIKLDGPVYKVVLKAKEKQAVNVTVNYVDDDNNQKVITIGNKTYTDNLSGKPKDPTNYKTQPTIDEIKHSGKYKLVSDANVPDNFPDKSNTYTVHFKEVIVPVGPNNPDSEDGYDATKLTKTAKEEIKYVFQNDPKVTDPAKMPSMNIYDPTINDISSTVTYYGSGYINKATGKLVNAHLENGSYVQDKGDEGKLTWTPASNSDKQFAGATTKVSEGYIADKATVDAQTVQVDSEGKPLDGRTQYVIYKKLGKIIPVDKDHNQLTGQPTPQYENDPDDPTKVKQTSKIHDIDGYNIYPKQPENVDPDNKIVTTPKDPTQDTEVVYDRTANTQDAVLKIYDDTSEKWIDLDGNETNQKTNVAEVKGDPSTVIGFANDNTAQQMSKIINLMDEGYGFVSVNAADQNNPKASTKFVNINPMTFEAARDAYMGGDKGAYDILNKEFGNFDADDNTTQTFVVHLNHQAVPVNPTNPGNPGENINDNDPRKNQSPKYPDGTAQKDLIKTYTRTINYVVEGNQNLAPDTITENVTFTGSGYIDKVTGQWVNVNSDGTINNSEPITDQSKGLTWTYVATKDGNSSNGDGSNYTFNAVPYVDLSSKGYHIAGTKDSDTDTVGFKATLDGKKYDGAKEDNNFGIKEWAVDPSTAGKALNITITYVPDKPKDQVAKGQIQYIDDDAKGKVLQTDQLQGKVGGEVKKNGEDTAYTTKDKIADYLSKGYELVSNDYSDGHALFNADKSKNQYHVHLKHKLQTVDPKNPGNPDKPNDPNGPKHPTDYKTTDLTKTITRTIQYEGAGDYTPSKQKQTVTFTQSGEFDEVTGKWTKPLTWNEESQDIAAVKTPVIPGYTIKDVNKDTTDHMNVDSAKILNSGKDYTVIVTYQPNGKIIPVDKDGNPIPNVDQPQFPTDPKNPNKTTDGKVPSVPGYHPENGKPGDLVIPDSDPTKNVNVPYVKDNNEIPATGKVTYIDDTTKQNLDSDALKGNVGDEITYSTAKKIANFENEGYVLVSDGLNDGGTKLFNKDESKNNFEVHLKHGTAPVGPKDPHKPGDKVNPNDPRDPKDQPTWPGKDTYTKNYTSTVHYQDKGGNTLAPDETQTSTWTRTLIIDKVTGKVTNPDETWKPDKDKYADANVPVIPGYVAQKQSKNGKVVSTTISGDPTEQNNLDDTVVYNPIGKIVPVGPDGKTPIPGASQPEYINDPKDPTNVKPNEPIPNVKGYTPKDPSPITPKDPTKDTPVIYEKNPDKPDQPVVNDQHAVVVYVDSDEKDENGKSKEITRSEDLVGKPKDKITDKYSTDSTIKALENKGYDLVEDFFAEQAPVFDSDDNTTQTYQVVLRHKHTTVNPKTPAPNPGQPVNPDDPNSPNWPTKDQMQIPGSQTIKYTGAGDKTPADKVTNIEFNHEVVIDNVTGKTIEDHGWTVTDENGKKIGDGQNYKFDTANTPVVDGYHADKGIAGGKNATVENPNVVDEVNYSPNGKIIPVDPSGKPIPDAPTPTYPTDPKDPTRVTPDEPVPNVPGKTPSQPTVTPKDPGKDTQVVYTTPTQDKGTVNVYVHDDTTDKDLPDYNWSSKEQKVGTKVDYDKNATFTDLTNKGYKIVDQSGVIIPETVVKGTTNVTIHVIHDTVPVDPKNPGKPGEPINPNDPNGPKYPSDSDQVTKDVTRTINFVDNNGNAVHKPVTQTVHFTGSGEIDKVTGQYTKQITWSPDQTVNGMDTPFVPGYHITNIDRDNNGLKEINDVTLSHKNDSYEVNVTYTPNGKIIPVDPSGEPIPNVPTPQYPTNPTDPTGVTPNEDVPDVPGYTPSTPQVTPQDPGKDTKVVYTKDDSDQQRIVIKYVDQDNNGALLHQDVKTGKSNTKLDYTTADEIKALSDKGYELVSSTFPTDGVTFDNDSKTDQTYVVTLKHGTIPVSPEKPGTPGDPINPNDPNGAKWPKGTDQNSLTKQGKQTIHYQGAGEKTPQDIVNQTTFEHNVVVDKVTGQIITDNGWTPDHHIFDSANTPVINGYHADKTVAGGKTVTVDNPEVTDTVTYTPNGKIVPVDPSGNPIPNVPTPQYPNDPKDPTKVTPDEKVPEIPGYKPSVPTVTPQNPGEDTKVVYTPDNKKATGEIDYIDDKTKTTIKVDPIKGTVGSKITNTTADQIKEFEDKGYKLVSSNFKDGQEVIKDSDNKFEIHFIHDTTTIDPKHPGDPGKPINPNDPNGPKWGDDTDAKSLTKTGVQIVHYVGVNGDAAPKDSVTSIEFDHQITIDKVTGKATSDKWTPDKQTYGKITTPEIPGYTADKTVVGGDTVNASDDNPNRGYIVIYTQNQSPVVPDTPDVPTPQPSQGTQVSQASQPTEPEQPTIPDEPDEDNNDEDEEVPDIPETHHKHHKKSSTNTQPRNTANHWSSNFGVHAQSWNSNVSPHAQTVSVLPNGDRVLSNGEVVNPQGQVVGYVDQNGQVHYTLPDTGANDNASQEAAVIGGIAMSLGLIGLAGVKKRRED